MSKENKSEHIRQHLILEGHKELLPFLPTPDYVQNIIILTNKGKIKDALNKIRHIERILEILPSSFEEEKMWLTDIIGHLKSAVG